MINKSEKKLPQGSPESKTNNVLAFPVHDRALKRNIKSQKHVAAVMKDVQNQHIEQAIDFIAPVVFTYLSQAGFDFHSDPTLVDEDETKQIAFLIEAIRAILSKKYNIDHPFQELAAATFKNDKTGGLKLATSVDVKFKKTKVG